MNLYLAVIHHSFSTKFAHLIPPIATVCVICNPSSSDDGHIRDIMVVRHSGLPCPPRILRRVEVACFTIAQMVRRRLEAWPPSTRYSRNSKSGSTGVA